MAASTPSPLAIMLRTTSVGNGKWMESSRRANRERGIRFDRKSLGCSPEDTVMPCCHAARRRGKPFRARLHSSSGVVMPLSASAMSFSDKLELTHAWAVLEARDPLRD